MNDETRQAFFDLYLEMVLTHQRWHGDSMRSDLPNNERNQAKVRSDKYHAYGGALDQIRLEIEERGYYRSHQHDLDIILKYLKKINDSTLSDKLQKIIDSLGSPQHV